MADISKIQVPGSATQYNIKDAQARRDIEDVKADLGALESNVFSVDAKYALAELLKNVTSADENAKQLYENLINAMGVDMLKENIFIYLPDQFGDLFIQNGSLVLNSIGNITKNMGINHNTDMGSRYRVIGSKNGKLESQKYMGLQSGKYFDLYPIPVPADATSAWIGVFPSERYVTSRLMHWNELNESYEVAEEASQKTQGSHIKTFSSGNNLFLAVQIAYDSSGSAYQGSPEAVVVAFKRSNA